MKPFESQLLELLREYDTESNSSDWKLYTDNGIIEQPRGRLLLENFYQWLSKRVEQDRKKELTNCCHDWRYLLGVNRVACKKCGYIVDNIKDYDSSNN